MTPTPSRREALTLLRSGPREYMSNADMNLLRTAAAAICALTALLTLAILPIAPPTRLLGPAAGWALASVYVLGGCAGAVAIFRHRRDAHLHVVYASELALLAGLGGVGWLAGDGDLYSLLPVLILVVVAASFPPARAFMALAIGFGCQLPALFAVGADTASVVELILHGFVWLCLGTTALLWTADVRAQRRALHANARVDALTGLGNRRAFDEAAVSELARSVRTGRPLGLLVGDLDDFKAINDRYGHLAGDACLRAVADVVRDLTRRPDACFRWGGDEFVVLLPEADLHRARAVAARLSDAVHQACRTPDGAPLRLAFGVAEREAELDPELLLARADADLLSAKDRPAERA